MVDAFIQSFIPRTYKTWNVLPLSSLPELYNLLVFNQSNTNKLDILLKEKCKILPLQPPNCMFYII